MMTKKIITIINTTIFIICLQFLIGCLSKVNRPTDLFFQALYQKGVDAYQQSNYQQAQVHWQEGYTLAQKDNESNKWAAHFLCGLARIAESIGEHKQAIQLAEQGLQIVDGVTGKALESEAHIIIGRAYNTMGNYDAAQDHAERAKQIALQIGDLKLTSDSYRTLGAINKDKGQLVLAQASYQEALNLAIKADDKLLQAKALNNLGELSHRLAQYEQAFAQYRQSLKLREALNDVAGQGNVLGNICRVYITQNELEQALAYCGRALEITRKIHDRAHESNHLNNIAEIFRDSGKYADAIHYSRLSLDIKQALSDLPGEAKTLNNMADIFRLEKKYQQAWDYFSRSLAIKRQLADRSGLSASNYDMGLSYADLGQYDDALNYLNEALLIQTELKEPELLWRIYSRLSHVHHHLGHQWPAVFFGKHAVNTIQSIRSSNQAQSKHLQQSYLKDKGDVYEQLANLLIDQGRLREAQKVLDMLKEEEYFDFIKRGGGNDPRTTTEDYTKKEADYETKYQALTRQLLDVGKEYTELSQKRQSNQTLTSSEQQRLEILDANLDNVRENYQKFVNELGQVFDKQSIELESISRYQGMLNEFKDNTVLIHYLVNDEKLRIILTGNNPSIPPIVRENSIKIKELNHLIFAFKDKLLTRAPVFKEAKDLYDHLIKPLEADLQVLKPKVLMIYPYQALRYLSFSALYDGNQYLVEHYAVAIFNAAAQADMSTPPILQWRVAGFGVSKSPNKEEFDDLPFVEDEINGIIKGESPKSTGILPGSRYFNQAFTPEKLMDTLKAKDAYQVFHLATHFKFSPGQDSLEKSFLLAGDGTQITLHKLLYGDYQMSKKQQLITLSACETATDEPKENDSEVGREVEGLGTLMQKKGAHAVLATLWEVDDCGTELFMKQFYKQREMQKLTKAEAIRQTQLGFIKGNLTAQDCLKRDDIRPLVKGTPKPAPNSEFLHPYYWAPFILMGNFL